MIKIGEYGFEPGVQTSPFGEVSEFQNHNRFIVETVQLRKSSLKGLNAEQYLSCIEPNVPGELISPKNFEAIRKFASHFCGNITNFFGFETKLDSSQGLADYLFAVSSRKGEREALVEMLKDESITAALMDRGEWQHIRNFVTEWANPDSPLYNRVLGFWFEFDKVEVSSEIPIPCVFIQTPFLRIDKPEDMEEFTWLTTSALPLLTGCCVSEKIERWMIQILQKLPKGCGLMDVGVMLSRAGTGVRFCIVRISPKQIIPYLTSLGWSDKDDKLSILLEELEEQVTRFVLHINITEEGVDHKIGIECSYSPDQYHLEKRWGSFLDYLIKKGVCLPERMQALLSFSGVEYEDSSKEFDLNTYQVSAKIQGNIFSGALVRFISHVKLVYKPDCPIQAKAYSGVRLFGRASIRPEEPV